MCTLYMYIFAGHSAVGAHVCRFIPLKRSSWISIAYSVFFELEISDNISFTAMSVSKIFDTNFKRENHKLRSNLCSQYPNNFET